MIGKINASQVYMPGNNKQHVYYPIEAKRNPPAQVQQPPPQNSFSFERTTGHRIERIRQKQVELLRKTNEELKQREQIYIEKLMKLEEGLENQHRQFIKLQQLYTELFQSYKQKQMEVAELETRFRQSDRYRETDRRDTNRSRDQQVSFHAKHYQEQQKETCHRQKQSEDQNRLKEWIEKEKEWLSKQHEYITMIDSLNLKLLKVNQNHDRVVQQMYYLKSKDKLGQSKAALTEKTMQELQLWQNQVDNQKQNRMKFQYQNQFLKSRNKDLQAQREQLQKLLAYKQKEIIKLREDKIRIHRQSSEKVMQRSPSKGTQSRYNLKNVVANTQYKQMEVASDKQKNNQSNSFEEISQNQYFSFSRSKNNNSVDSELPNFPAELQIDQLINVHRQ